MPPSGRKGKTRTRKAQAAEAQEPSDVETPEAIQTPSRASRKRARAQETAAAPAPRNTRRKIKDTRNDREDTEGTEPQDGSDAETEQALPTEAEIIAHLKVADRLVNATEDYANDLLEGQENVPGYGKIAGRDWVFIIRKVEVNIGRPEQLDRLPVDGEGQQSGGPSAKTVVDIDLGPDRQVSRSHAVISYDSDSMGWFIIVNGRNGLRLDNNLLRRGSKSFLRNGAVIEIANTQMAFITTSNDDNEGPIWDGSIIRQAQKSSEDDDDGEDDQRMHNFRTMGLPGSRNQLPESNNYGTTDFAGQQRRTHPHSQQHNMQAAAPPGTPMRNQQSLMKSSPGGANYSRGVMMESTETIDYADDSAKDLKPPHSYAQLIGMAILSTPEQQMTLNNIYKWIMANYAFYRFNTGGWQNSIRHNLSLNKAFTKIARRTDEPGKGMKWMIDSKEFDQFVQQGMKGCRRPNPLPGTQSTFGSPNSPMNLMKQGANGVKKDEEMTPPMNAYRPAYTSAMEAYTPDRGSKRDPNVGLGINGDGPEYDYQTRSTPRNNLTAMANAAGSPPALFNEEGRVGPLDTPWPLRPTQRFAPPSTLKRPSDFIQLSSPAPFWRQEGFIGSTPFKPYDLSPLKTPFSGFKKGETEAKKEDEGDANGTEKDEDAKEDEQDEEPKDKGSPIIHSSSPPRPNSAGNGPESPTMSRPATAAAKTLSQLSTSQKEKAAEEDTANSGSVQAQEEPSTAPTTQATSAPTSAGSNTQTSATLTNGNGYTSQNTSNHSNSYSYTTGPATGSMNGGAQNGFHDDGDDGGIDLAKGFQPIGAFHQRNHMAMGMGMPPTAQVSGYGR